MYKVYFRPSVGRDRVVGKHKEYKGAEQLIFDFLKEKNYKAPYYRTWQTEYKGKKAIKFDVGSHTEFFYVVIQ